MMAYNNAFLINKILVEKYPNNLEYKRKLSLGFIYQGNIYKSDNDDSKAREYYYKAHHITKEITNKDPSNKKWQHDLSISYIRLGDIYTTNDSIEKALVSYKNALKVSEKLNSKHPNTPLWERNLSVIYIKLGNLYEEIDSGQAINYYQKSVNIRKKLVTYDKNNFSWQRDYIVSLISLGDIYHDPNEALKIFKSALDISYDNREKLQRDISIIYDRMGLIYKEKNNNIKAIYYYNKSCSIAENLASNFKNDILMQLDLVISYRKLFELGVINNNGKIGGILDNLLRIKREKKLSLKNKEKIKKSIEELKIIINEIKNNQA